MILLAILLAFVSGMLLSPPVANAFAFTALTPRASALAAPTADGSTHPRSARLAAGTTAPRRFGGTRRSPHRAGRTPWARRAKQGGNAEEEKPYIPGSGLRGVDTSKLTGNDKRDAEWFQRTAEREARGELQWFEDPVVYIALFALVPVFIGIWGVLNCYIPGFCAAF